MLFKRKRFYLMLLCNVLLIIFYWERTHRKSVKETNLKVHKGTEELKGWERTVKRRPPTYLYTFPKILPEDFCTQEYLIIMVHSAPSNKARRDLVRRTWGQLTVKDTSIDQVAMYFVLGTTTDPTIQGGIVEESESHGDIIQENFHDSYLNLTIKSLIILKLTTLWCYRKAKYLLKCDDDTFVNVDNIIKLLSISPTKDLLVGYLVCDNPVQRNPQKKWYMPRYLFEDDRYPRYLAGGAYLMTIQVAKRLYINALSTPMVPLEDVYVTGMCAQKAGIVPRHSVLFGRMREGECWMREACAIQDVPEKMMQRIYRVVANLSEAECQVERFSTFRWLTEVVLRAADNPFGYRKYCV